MSIIFKHSYLELIIGPMFSGKTSKIVELYKKYTFCDIPVLVINHSLDKRYTSNDITLSTHDKQVIPCVSTDLIANIITDENLKKYNVILINEGQFFEDIDIAVKTLVEQHSKTVYVCGLDGDFQRKKFGKLLDLIPIADNIIKLHSLCYCCKDGTKAPFTARITKETEQTVIGSNIYIPLCRKCYSSKLVK